MPTTTTGWSLGALITPTWTATGLNSLAHNARALTETITPTGELLAYPELFTSGFSGTPGVSASVLVWLIKAMDGTNYERGDITNPPARNPDFQLVVPPTASLTNQRWTTVGPILLPGCPYKVLKQNNTGVAYAASGNTFKFRTLTFKGVS